MLAQTNNMDIIPSTEETSKVILTLYQNPDPKEKERASKWLQDLQKSVYAWKVSDDLLHQGLSKESCYIAAQTMRTKIQKSFGELPTDAHVSLRNSILDHVSNIDASTSSIIVTQLCLALSDLMLLMSEWTNSIPEVMERLSLQRSRALLELLIVLPEEVSSRHLRLGPTRRCQIIANLRQHVCLVNNFLTHCLTSEKSEQNTASVLRCITSWIQLDVVPLQGIELNPIIIEAFTILRDQQSDELHDAATECICALLECLEDKTMSENGVVFDDSLRALEFGLYSVIRSLGQSYQNAMLAEDLNKVTNYCRIFTELCETFLLKILAYGNQPQLGDSQFHFAINAFDLVLVCCQHPDYEVIDVTFNLWYRLSEELYQRNCDQLTIMFKRHIQMLSIILCRHCAMEVDSITILNENDDFSDFRCRVMELMKDVVFIIGSFDIYKHLLEVWQNDKALTWSALEANVFFMVAVARNILPVDEEVVAPSLECALQISTNDHVAVLHTCIRLVGELCDWIEAHPVCIERVLEWLLIHLRSQNKRIAGQAASSLQNLYSSCRHHLISYFAGLLGTVEALDSFQLKNSDATSLIRGIATIVTSLPSDQMYPAVQRLCDLQMTQISAILNNDKLCANKDPIVYLDRLAAIFVALTSLTNNSGTSNNNNVNSNSLKTSCKSVLTSLWPVLSTVLQRFIDDSRVIERTCRCLRYYVRCLGTESIQLLSPLVEQMVQMYKVKPHSCFLYLASILVHEYGHIPECTEGLLQMLEAFCVPTLAILDGSLNILNDSKDMKHYPDTVDDFFRLNLRFVQCVTIPYMKNSEGTLVDAVLKCAVFAVSRLEHRHAHASVMRFLIEILQLSHHGQEKPTFSEQYALVQVIVYQNFGEKLVHALVEGVAVNQLPKYTFIDIGDALFELLQNNREKFALWFKASLARISHDDKMIEDFFKFVTNASASSNIINALMDFNYLWR